MSEVNFSRKKAPAASPDETKAATPEQAVQPTSTTTAVARTGQELGDYVPTADQIILPRINIVQGVGKLKDNFPVGAIVLNQQTVLFKLPVRDGANGEVKEKGTKPLNITCVGFKPIRYVEMVQGGARGMVVYTEQEVQEAKGTLDYQTWAANKATMKRFSPYVEGLFLIEKPEELVSEAFPYVIDGKPHAIVLWAMKGTAYTAAAKKTFFTERLVGCLKNGGYPSMQFALSTVFQRWGENGAFVPHLIATTKSTDERITFCQNFLSAAASATTEDNEDE